MSCKLHHITKRATSLYINRRGLSEVVAYVLLVGIAVALSIAVYYFINSYLPKQASECPEGLSIVIYEYKCETSRNELNLTLQNKGLFDIDGFIIKASNDSNLPAKSLKYNNGTGTQSVGVVYIDDNAELVLKPSGKFNRLFNYSDNGLITKLQIIPFKNYKGESLLCGRAQVTQNAEGCG